MRTEIERIVNVPDAIEPTLLWVKQMAQKGLQRGPVAVRLGRPRRTLDQNKKLWPMLTDISNQVDLVVNGVPVHARPEDWKDVFTAYQANETRIALGLDGNPVFLGQRTRKMSKAQFSDLIELIYSYGAEHDVAWSEKARDSIREYNPRVIDYKAA